MTSGDTQPRGEESLGVRFQRGEDDALHELYRRYAGPMYVTAISLLGDREQAADAVQRAFVQACRAADGFDPNRELKPWLYAITRRAAVDVYRRERRTAGHVSLQVVRELSDDGPSMDRIWRSWQVREALDQLSREERQVLELAYFQGLSQSEIAGKLDIALGTVKSRTSRAQRRLAAPLPHLRETAQAAAS
jgi:RNA polymerase sigma-70 factor (ECF subfamily)